MYSNSYYGLKINDVFTLIKNEILYGAHLISLVSPCFIITVSILMNLQINILSLIVAYLIPLIVYTYNYYGELDKDVTVNPEKTQYLEKRKKAFPHLLYIYIIALIILLFIIQNLGFIAFIVIILCGGLLYTIIFKELTRTIPGFKSIYTALIWAYAGTFYAIFFYGLKFSTISLLIFITIFIKSIINVVFFDIKDVESDAKENLKTIPILLGKQNTLYLLNLLNVISLIVIMYGIFINLLPVYSIAFLVIFLYTSYYLYKGKTNDSKELFKYTYIMADAEFIFWPIIILLGKILIG